MDDNPFEFLQGSVGPNRDTSVVSDPGCGNRRSFGTMFVVSVVLNLCISIGIIGIGFLPAVLLLAPLIGGVSNFGQIGMLIYLLVPYGLLVGLGSASCWLRGSRGLILYAIAVIFVILAWAELREIAVANWTFTTAFVLVTVISMGCNAAVISRLRKSHFSSGLESTKENIKGV